MAIATATRDGIVLTCDIARVDDSIVFSYSLANEGATAVFVMDADIAIDTATQRRHADPAAATAWLGADGYAQVLKGVAALPEGVDPQTRIMPLARRLEPGQRMERRLAQAMPLVEHSPYAPPGLLRAYRLAPIQGVALNVDMLPADRPGMAAPARDLGAGYFRMLAPDDPADVPDGIVLFSRLACGFRARGLFMMVRLDNYPRPD